MGGLCLADLGSCFMVAHVCAWAFGCFAGGVLGFGFMVQCVAFKEL